MKNLRIKIAFFAAAISLIVILSNCTKREDEVNKAVDCVVPTAKETVIGAQTWMTMNLNVDTFRNGDPIPLAKTAEEWKAAYDYKQPMSCYVNFDASTAARYGKLYNWHAVADSRGLAPVGWKIPSKADWEVLWSASGTNDGAAMNALKNTTCWAEIQGRKTDGNNATGFSAIPSGTISALGKFSFEGEMTAFWSSNEEDEFNGSTCDIFEELFELKHNFEIKGCGNAIRCLKDDQSNPDCILPTNTQVQIGSQIWMTSNLDVSRFRNGDLIPEARTDAEWEAAGTKKQPAWCYMDNNAANAKKFGKLYNWYAVIDSRGLAPSGWHIPSITEWRTLSNFFGDSITASMKLKSSTCWDAGLNGTNESGFFGFASGLRYNLGAFSGVGYENKWYTSSLHFEGGGYWFSLGGSTYWNYFLPEAGTYGYSVRCVKD
jgi:uncharacterized protein (TIGR02145 family)